VRRAFPAEVPGWLAAWREDQQELAQLRSSQPRLEQGLEAYQGLGRACAFLGSDQACRVYPLRPMMCRIYLSFSEPAWCHPGHQRHAGALTYLLDLDEVSEAWLDLLDRRFGRLGGAAGLPVLMSRYLA